MTANQQDRVNQIGNNVPMPDKTAADIVALAKQPRTVHDLIACGVTRALTLWPEWAWAITALDKRVENRGFPIPRTIVGQRIAIHAGANIGGGPGIPTKRRGIEAMLRTAAAAGWETGGVYQLGDHAWMGLTKGDRRVKLDSPGDIPTGVIVATAVLREAMYPEVKGPWKVPGQWGWHLEDVQVLATPITPLPGWCHQGFWSLAATKRAVMGGGL